ncbi:DUF4255 domain-containing protein [Nocardioides sp. GY 10113]|uniref:DUF4255 domain-containing protein n=1 Tax=Nocardioides sp. GY 10113 TaxID=2569761 RepID=UPI0010A7C706|nr:DUF4255 domain-containing protein [Nocardioides sp. GY 10113]TIC88290.1 DUF4255 domain-containing protein [Nocardioides sp. GY 10113]
MSNALAVAATTATLVNLLVQATPNVTALPPDKAHDEGVEEQLNLFLYSLDISAAWRNADPPGLPPGETGPAPLPLVLRYLVTAFAGSEVRAHALLGAAMSVLHDHPVLGSDEILDATSGPLPGSDLHQQAERLRITPAEVPLHDMSDLWSSFSASFRISQAYEVGVVLIDSNLPRTAPLPVLRQGPGSDAPLAVPAPAAVLTAALPSVGSVAVLGATLRLLGTGLAQVTSARLRSRRLPAPVDLVPAPAGEGEMRLALPDPDAGIDSWAAGVYDVTLTTQRPGLPAVVSNTRSFGLGPRITVAPATAPAGDVTLTLTCRPRLRAGQEVAVVLGSAAPVAPTATSTPADPTQPSTVTATLPGVAPGSHVVRLRVDGVDSDPVRMAGSPPRPEFDPAVQVVVT